MSYYLLLFPEVVGRRHGDVCVWYCIFTRTFCYKDLFQRLLFAELFELHFSKNWSCFSVTWILQVFRRSEDYAHK